MKIVRNNKEIFDDTNFNLLKTDMLCTIAIFQPEYCICYNLSKLDGDEWEMVLSRLPQLSIYCNWDKLKSKDWRFLLRYNPQFAEYCNWDKLTGYDWSRILYFQPQFKMFRKNTLICNFDDTK